jgi:hypothetical protein
LTDLSASGIALDYVGVAVRKGKGNGHDILGRDWDFRCSTTFWEECLSLAEAFGWERAGTVAPATCHQGDCHDSWDGNYRTNDYQQVTDDDARAFAAGLKRAIDAVMKEPSLNVAQTRTINGHGEAPRLQRWIGHIRLLG